MPLGYGAISMQDVFFELYGRYPNPGESYSLAQLASLAGVPPNLLAFRGYSAAPTVVVSSSNIVNSYDMVDVTWILYLSAAFPNNLDINVREVFDSSGSSSTYPMQIPAGSTTAQFPSSYWKETVSYTASWEILPGNGYIVGAESMETLFVPKMVQQFPSSSSSSQSL